MELSIENSLKNFRSMHNEEYNSALKFSEEHLIGNYLVDKEGFLSHWKGYLFYPIKAKIHLDECYHFLSSLERESSLSHIPKLLSTHAFK